MELGLALTVAGSNLKLAFLCSPVGDYECNGGLLDALDVGHGYVTGEGNGKRLVGVINEIITVESNLVAGLGILE